MADNVNYNPSGTTAFATKDDGTAHHQKTIIEGQNLAGSVIALGKAEDEAHSSGDGGVMALAVRKDTAAALAGTDGDYAPLEVDANGRLHVIVASSKVDDAAFTPATDTVVMIGAEADEGSPDAVDEGDAGALRMTLQRGLHVNVRNASGTELAVAQEHTTAGSPSSARLSDGSGFYDAAKTGQLPSALVSSRLDVNIGAAPATLIAGGDLAHDDADSTSKPVKIGGRAIAHGSNPTAVAADDWTNLYANRHGIPFYIGGHPNIITRRDNYNGSQTDAAIVTVSTGAKIVVTQIQVTADSAMTATPAVRIGFGATNTPTGAGVVASHPGLAGGGGFSRGDGSGMLGVGADNEDLRITMAAPTGGSIDVVTSYYTIES